jgi:hypothetical protein
MTLQTHIDKKMKKRKKYYQGGGALGMFNNASAALQQLPFVETPRLDFSGFDLTQLVNDNMLGPRPSEGEIDFLPRNTPNLPDISNTIPLYQQTPQQQLKANTSASPNAGSKIMDGLANAASSVPGLGTLASLGISAMGKMYFDKEPSSYVPLRNNNMPMGRGFKYGGKMQNAGRSTQDRRLSHDSALIQGNPQVTDGNRRQVGGDTYYLDHNEVIAADTVLGPYALSPNLINPLTGNVLAKDGKKVKKAQGNAESYSLNVDPTDQITLATTLALDNVFNSLILENERQLQADPQNTKHVQETRMNNGGGLMAASSQQAQNSVRKMKTNKQGGVSTTSKSLSSNKLYERKYGGKLKYQDGGGFPPGPNPLLGNDLGGVPPQEPIFTFDPDSTDVQRWLADNPDYASYPGGLEYMANLWSRGRDPITGLPLDARYTQEQTRRDAVDSLVGNVNTGAQAGNFPYTRPPIYTEGITGNVSTGAQTGNAPITPPVQYRDQIEDWITERIPEGYDPNAVDLEKQRKWEEEQKEKQELIYDPIARFTRTVDRGVVNFGESVVRAMMPTPGGVPNNAGMEGFISEAPYRRDLDPPTPPTYPGPDGPLPHPTRNVDWGGLFPRGPLPQGQQGQIPTMTEQERQEQLMREQTRTTGTTGAAPGGTTGGTRGRTGSTGQVGTGAPGGAPEGLDVRAFQQWVADTHAAGKMGNDANPLANYGVDGQWGPETAAAYAAYRKRV